MIALTVFKFRSSTALESIEHDGIALATVRFKNHPNDKYQYYPVTGAQVQRIADAKSCGKMFHVEIRDNPSVTMIRKLSE